MLWGGAFDKGLPERQNGVGAETMDGNRGTKGTRLKKGAKAQKPGRQPVTVVFHAGYRGRETPRELHVGREVIPVLEVISRARIQDHPTGLRREVFRLKVAAGEITLQVFPGGRAEINRDD